MANYLTNTEELTSVANAIRTKSGGSSPLAFPSGFVSEIGNIPSGGDVSYNEKTLYLNITFSNYYGEGEISFNILVQTKTTTPAQTVYSKTYNENDATETIHLALDLTDYIPSDASYFHVAVNTATKTGDMRTAYWTGIILPNSTNSAAFVSSDANYPSSRSYQNMQSGYTYSIGCSRPADATTAIIDINIELED